jgi:hypothetical protein
MGSAALQKQRSEFVGYQGIVARRAEQEIGLITPDCEAIAREDILGRPYEELEAVALGRSREGRRARFVGRENPDLGLNEAESGHGLLDERRAS